MEEDEVIKTRFAEEVGALGVSKLAIANRIGFSSQTFTNVISGRNMPGALLLSRISREFPSFDANYVLTGERKADESKILKKLREELEFKDSLLRITTRAAKSELVGLGKFKDATFRPNSPSLKFPMPIPSVNKYTNTVSKLSWVASSGLVCANA